MIIDIHEKYDVSPEWFEKEAARDPRQALEARLCEMLAVYRVQNQAGAEKAAEKMIAAGVDREMVRAAME